MTPANRPVRSFLIWAGLGLASAFLLAMASDLLFGSGGTILFRWLPNVGAVILAFSLPGRSFPGLLAGHATGLFLAGLNHDPSTGSQQWHHVGADVLETAMMVAVLGRIAPDGRLARSSDFLRVVLGVVVLPALASAAVFGLGQALLGRDFDRDVWNWVAASIGVSAIVLVPWLAARSHVSDDPFSGTDSAGRHLRLAASALLLALAFALPLAGRTEDDALVALLVLMASAWLPVRLVALLIALLLALHDAAVRDLVGLGGGGNVSSASDVLRGCVIGMAALYVRLLLAENRIALQKAREERLTRERESKKFLGLVDQIDGIVWEAEAETARFTFVSAAAERLTGYAVEEWLAPGFWLRHMHPGDTSWAPAFCADQTRSGRDHAFDYRFVAKDGRVLWIRDIVTLRKDSDGRLMLAGVMFDITASKQAALDLEEALASLDRLAIRHRLALTAGGIGVWETDVASGESEWDDTMFRLFGAEPEADCSPRQLMRERFAPESLGRARAALARMRAGDAAPYTEDYTVHLQSGETRRLRSVVAPMEVREGRACMVGATWDCSMEAIAEEALRQRADQLAAVLEAETMRSMQARTQAAHAEAVQSDLVANVSHELRTPLHAILGFLDLSLEDLKGRADGALEQAAWKIERSHSAAKRLLAQVDDLLDLAKLESGTMLLRKRRLDFRGLVTAVRDELGAVLMAKGIQVTVGSGSDIADGPVWIEADEVRMLQVLRNILANSVKFSPENSEIRIRWQRVPGPASEEALEVRFEDQGPGIPDDQLEAVFGKFVQVRAAERRSEAGTGLGLPIARRIARAHGGDLRAEGCAHGATLVLMLPLA